MESELIYSKEALEAKATFYNKDFAIYVEGKDDILFWNTICGYAGVKNYHIEDVGGDPIKDYQKIILENQNTDFIVACDLNFDDFKSNRITSKRIVTTYGHSIENTMYYMIEKIDHVVKQYSKTIKSSVIEITEAIFELCKKLYKLIVYDVANDLFDKSVSMLSNSCSKYLLVEHSYQLCDKKIDATVNKFRHLFTVDELKYCEKHIKKSKKEIWFYIRGHFLTTWLYKLIKTLSETRSGVKVDITYDAIYSAFIDCKKNQKDMRQLIKNMKIATNDIY